MLILNEKKWNATIYKKKDEEFSSIYLDNEKIILDNKLNHDIAKLIITLFNMKTYYLAKVNTDSFKLYQNQIDSFKKGVTSFKSLVESIHDHSHFFLEIEKVEEYQNYLYYKLSGLRMPTIDISIEIDEILNSEEMRNLAKTEFDKSVESEKAKKEKEAEKEQKRKEQKRKEKNQETKKLTAYNKIAKIMYQSRKSDFLDDAQTFYKKQKIKKTKKELAIYWKGPGEYVISNSNIITKEEFNKKF